MMFLQCIRFILHMSSTLLMLSMLFLLFTCIVAVVDTVDNVGVKDIFGS
jgi:hypothetical protein